MASGRGSIEVMVTTDVAMKVLGDLQGWAKWMPGVQSIESVSDEVVRWSVMTPGGPVPIPLRFDLRKEGLSFTKDEDDGGAFRVLEGTVQLQPSGAGSSVALEMKMETSPPAPPAEFVGQLVQGALSALSMQLRSAARESASDSSSTALEPQQLRVRMSDGVEIAVNRYSTATTPAPAALMFLPYRKEGALVGELAKMITGAGLDFFIADVRGFGGSPAEYQGLLSEREITDGFEVIEWIAKSEFCNGRIGTMGGSYVGANQILFASRKPPSLVCISPYVGPVDTYRDWTHRGGIPSHILWGAGTYLRSQHPSTARRGLEQYYLDFLTDPLDNVAHRKRSPETYFGDVEVPALCLGGWHDYFLRGTLRTFNGVTGPKRLVVGPWGHGDFSPRHQEELTRWLKFWLLGEGDDPTSGKRVHLFDTGTESWRELDDWPSQEDRGWRRFHLSSGRLQSVPADAETAARVVTHVEAVPMATNPKRAFIPDPTDSGMGLWGEDISFDSEPFDSDQLVEGPVAAVLSIAAEECEDFDVHARLSLITDDGSATQLIEGRLRASHHALEPGRTEFSPEGDPIVPWHPHDRPERLDGNPVELAIEMGAICHTFKAGEKVRLGLTLVRSDERSQFSKARVMPESRLLLPFAGS